MEALKGGDALAGRPVLLATPFYRAAHLVAPLLRNLALSGDELAGIGASVYLINDSPDDPALAAALQAEAPALAAVAPVRLLTNAANLGFVRSANRAMEAALAVGADVLLLNSDALPRPGALREIAEVARIEPLIGAVSPRSDNATLCNSPYLDTLRAGGPEAAYRAHRALQDRLPRFTYAPTAVGFCLYLRWEVLEEFGLFDEAYSPGYNEENDLIRRMNQSGYRAVLANRAYVHHQGEVSFAQSPTPRSERQACNHRLLVRRYPEYPGLVARYFEGADHAVQRLMGGFVPEADGRLRLTFDCRFAGRYYSGTHEHAWALLRAFAAAYRDRYRIAVVCDRDAFEFHGLHREADLAHSTPEAARALPAAAVVRIGQPFHPADLDLIGRAAPVSGVLMLDTIAMDCQQLDDADLDPLWTSMLDGVDLLAFNSDFTRGQFAHRFRPSARVEQVVSRCSTRVGDYAAPAGAAAQPGGPVLVVGNHYPHKHVRPMVEALRRADPARPILALGLELQAPGVEGYRAGELPQALVDRLYERASAVVLASHYEGFGLPILHGLARRRPVIARDLPFAREIGRVCPQAALNLHLAGSTRAMAALALDPPPWREPAADAGQGGGWEAAARALGEGLERAIARFDYAVAKARQVAIAATRGVGSRPIPVAVRPHDQEGFMLGRELEAALEAVGQVAGEPAAAARLRLEGEAAHDPLRALDHLLPWLDAQPLGGALVLECEGDPERAEAALRPALLALGAAPLQAERLGDGVRIGGLKARDWRGDIGADVDDLAFVQQLYRRFLGRAPDAAGARNYAGELAGGRDRQEVMQTFVRSPERLARIVEQLAALDRAPTA